MKEVISSGGASVRTNTRTAILTTDRESFLRVRNLKPGQTVIIECPNDIISSGRNEKGNNHHSLRRISLIRRAISIGHRRVKVRYEQGNEVYCSVCGKIDGKDDAASFKIWVSNGIGA